MTFPQYQDIRRMWAEDCPPVHRMIARYLGYGKKKKTEAITEQQREDSMENLLTMFGLGPVTTEKLSGALNG